MCVRGGRKTARNRKLSEASIHREAGDSSFCDMRTAVYYVEKFNAHDEFNCAELILRGFYLYLRERERKRTKMLFLERGGLFLGGGFIIRRMMMNIFYGKFTGKWPCSR